MNWRRWLRIRVNAIRNPPWWLAAEGKNAWATAWPFELVTHLTNSALNDLTYCSRVVASTAAVPQELHVIMPGRMCGTCGRRALKVKGLGDLT